MDPLDVTKGTLQALAGQVPVVGSVLTGVFPAQAREMQEKRLRECLEDLRSEFTNFLEEDFDRGYPVNPPSNVKRGFRLGNEPVRHLGIFFLTCAEDW